MAAIENEHLEGQEADKWALQLPCFIPLKEWEDHGSGKENLGRARHTPRFEQTELRVREDWSRENSQDGGGARYAEGAPLTCKRLPVNHSSEFWSASVWEETLWGHEKDQSKWLERAGWGAHRRLATVLLLRQKSDAHAHKASTESRAESWLISGKRWALTKNCSGPHNKS